MNGLTSSPHHSSPVDKVSLAKQPSLSRETRQHSHLALSGRMWFSFRLWNYSDKPSTASCRNQGAPYPLSTTKSAFSCPFWSTLFPKQSLCDPAWHVISSSPWLWVYILRNCCWSRFSCVEERRFSHPRNLQVGIPLSLTGEEKPNTTAVPLLY